MTSLGPGSLIAGKYRLERLLSRGGMGAVWVARHLQLDVPLAVKLMESSHARSAEARARFEREARACARLKSPHIIQVHDYGVEGDAPYLVMELLDGEDLRTRLQRGRLAVADAVPLAVQIGKALRIAHDAGIVHRDLKPANIFLARQHGEEILKVLDFGIAKFTLEAQIGESTTTGAILGSPHYMSPEQVRAAKDIDARTDLWSFGVILFRVLTGALPFPGDQLSAVLVAICSDPIPAPSQVVPGLGPDVDAFFARALARDPAQRFQSAGEMTDAFVALAGGAWMYPPSFSSISAVSGVLPADGGGTLSPAGRSVPPRPPRSWALGASLAALVLSGIGIVALILLRGRAPEPAAIPMDRIATTSAAPPPTAGLAEPTPAVVPSASAEAPAPSTSAEAPAPSATAGPKPPSKAKAPAGPAKAPEVAAPPPSKADATFGF